MIGMSTLMSDEVENAWHAISTLNEKALHAAVKNWYAEPGDRLEVLVDGFLIDIVRGDLLIEIQTRNLSAIKRKLGLLAKTHRVRLVVPVAQDKWIVRLTDDGTSRLSRRKSPKHGCIESIFEELVSVPALLSRPDFSLDVLLIKEEEVRRRDGSHRAWRRGGWVTQERRLLEVVERRTFESPGDLAALIPASLVDPFDTAHLAESIGQPRWLAQKMAYCLREMGAITPVGKNGNAVLYGRAGATTGRSVS